MIFSYHSTPIYYTDKGQGSVIILLHGFLESSTMWKQIQPHFSKTHRVITLDFPGHGKTPCIGNTHSMELFADVVSALLENLDIATATVVGHSMGGYVALAFAEHHAARINNLVLLNSSALADSESRKQNRERALQLVPKAKDAFVGMAISNLFSRAAHSRFTSEISEVKKEALTFPLAGITAAIKGMKERKDNVSILKNFGNSKYMICGKHDPIIAITECRQLALQTNTTIFELDGGHMSHIENTAEIVKILYLIENNCT